MFMSILLLLISTSTGLSLSKRDQEADEYKEVRFRSELHGPWTGRPKIPEIFAKFWLNIEKSVFKSGRFQKVNGPQN